MLTGIAPVRMRVRKVRDRSGEGTVYQSTLIRQVLLSGLDDEKSSLQYLTIIRIDKLGMFHPIGHYFSPTSPTFLCPTLVVDIGFCVSVRF